VSRLPRDSQSRRVARGDAPGTQADDLREPRRELVDEDLLAVVGLGIVIIVTRDARGSGHEPPRSYDEAAASGGRLDARRAPELCNSDAVILTSDLPEGFMLRSARPSGGGSPTCVAWRGRLQRIALLVALAAAPARDAGAMCNVIPGATTEFRGALGATNRPFASPGDFVRIRVRPTVCDTGSTGFVDLDGDSVLEDDYVVTVLYEPPQSVARHAVVLAQSCPSQPELDGSAAALGLAAGEVPCVEDSAAGLDIPNDEDLSFRFPDTDALVGTPDDDRTLTGPAKLIVTAATAPLPCGLAVTSCAGASNVVACVDDLFEIDGTCRTDAARIR
jgi:hypothetical protein